MNKMQTHEIYRDNQDIKISSEKSFGLVFAAVFLIVALWPLSDEKSIRYWALIVASGFSGLALFCPQILRPLNVAWFKFGLLLHKIVNPFVLGFVFVATIIPTGLIRRLLKKDSLRLCRQDKLETYWITSTPEQQNPENYKRQF